MLEHSQASNGTVEDLLKEVGPRPVKFGQIVKGDASGRLGIAEPEYVSVVPSPVASARGESSEKTFVTTRMV